VPIEKNELIEQNRINQQIQITNLIPTHIAQVYI